MSSLVSSAGWSFLSSSSPRIAVFSVTVLHDDRIVLVAEQRPDASEEDSFQWMSRVLQVGPGGWPPSWPLSPGEWF